jgi:hypothetical protein
VEYSSFDESLDEPNDKTVVTYEASTQNSLLFQKVLKVLEE